MLNIKGKLLSLDKPVVMGILNATPDSFYADSRFQNDEAITKRIETIITEGGALIDIGGCSTSPEATEVKPEEEWQRIEPALKILHNNYPDIPLSVDTFRAEIAKRAVTAYGVSMINDISGGASNEKMFETVAELGVPYILTHFCDLPQPPDNNRFLEETLLYFAKKMQTLRSMGVNDVIIDPGFGFGKSLEQNYILLQNLKNFTLLFDCPLLIGISRKSMIYNLLDCTPAESLNGTTVLHTFSLLNGADILRVHDVKEAVEVVKLVDKLKC